MVDGAGIRAIAEQSLVQFAEALPLSEKALELHLQRLVGAFVGSAFGAGQFYSNKVSEARDLTAKLGNEERDEDRDGVSGFDSKAERGRLFAAEKGIQAHALAVAAEGAAAAYAYLSGQDWKPYQAPRRRDGQPDECLGPARSLRLREGRAGLRSRLPSRNFSTGNTAGEKAGLAIVARRGSVELNAQRLAA